MLERLRSESRSRISQRSDSFGSDVLGLVAFILSGLYAELPLVNQTSMGFSWECRIGGVQRWGKIKTYNRSGALEKSVRQEPNLENFSLTYFSFNDQGRVDLLAVDRADREAFSVFVRTLADFFAADRPTCFFAGRSLDLGDREPTHHWLRQGEIQGHAPPSSGDRTQITENITGLSPARSAPLLPTAPSNILARHRPASHSLNFPKPDPRRRWSKRYPRLSLRSPPPFGVAHRALLDSRNFLRSLAGISLSGTGFDRSTQVAERRPQILARPVPEYVLLLGATPQFYKVSHLQPTGLTFNGTNGDRTEELQSRELQSIATL
jgi:hypothetical protein